MKTTGETATATPATATPRVKINPAARAKKPRWVEGLTDHDLDILRHNLSEVKVAESPGDQVKPRAIRVSPVEFANLASQLAQHYSRSASPQRYFRAADELIRLADFYLRRNRREISARLVAEAEREMNEGYVAIQVALRPIPVGTGEKKSKTQLGNISTRNGLIKALKRLYGEKHLDHIVQRNFRIKGRNIETAALHQTTIDRILEDQRQANERRGQRKTDASKAK